MSSTPLPAVSVIEALEARRLLAADVGGATLEANGTLVVNGTAGDDHIILDGVRRISSHHPSSDVLHVSNVHPTQPRFGDVIFESDFALADVQAIVVHGGEGGGGSNVGSFDDLLDTVSGVDVDARLEG